MAEIDYKWSQLNGVHCESHCDPMFSSVCVTIDVDAVNKITIGLPQKYPAEVFLYRLETGL